MTLIPLAIILVILFSPILFDIHPYSEGVAIIAGILGICFFVAFCVACVGYDVYQYVMNCPNPFESIRRVLQ